MFYSLKEEGAEVIAINAELSGWRRTAAAFKIVSLNKARWRSKFRYGNQGAKHRTAAAFAALGNTAVDAILQIGLHSILLGLNRMPFIAIGMSPWI